VGRYYQDLDVGAFDYELCRVDGIAGVWFRGPSIDLSRPYVACIGAAQTFGRFCPAPFPALLGDRLGVQVLNLGVGGAGPQLFRSERYLEILNAAEAVVVQVLSGRSEGNSLFDNADTGSLFGVRVRDGKRMRFEDFLSDLLAAGPPELVKRTVQDTRARYARHMASLLDAIRRPTVLFWFSSRSPDYEEDYASVGAILAAFPQLVNRATLEEIRPHTNAYVECISGTGLPQQLWRAETAIDGTTTEGSWLVNSYYPSPEMHAEAAALLTPVCARLMSSGGMRA